MVSCRSIPQVRYVNVCQRAFAREGGLPFSNYLSRVSSSALGLRHFTLGSKLISMQIDEKTRLPIWAIATTTIINLLLALINIGSSVGFTAFHSLIIAGYYSSLILAAGVILHKRLATPESEIPFGPFHMSRRTGMVVYILVIAYCFVGGFLSMWPSFVNPTPDEMNWCVLVYGGALLSSIIFWFAYGRKRYTGPVIEI